MLTTSGPWFGSGVATGVAGFCGTGCGFCAVADTTSSDNPARIIKQ
jgi:hypothetical protein